MGWPEVMSLVGGLLRRGTLRELPARALWPVALNVPKPSWQPSRGSSMAQSER